MEKREELEKGKDEKKVKKKIKWGKEEKVVLKK